MVLEIKNLKKSYGEHEALKNLNVKLTSGIYGLLGPNGAGKSTLMKLICMLLEPSGGEILFDGEDIRAHKKKFLKGLGYMPQHSCLYPEFGVLEYLYYIGALKGMNRRTLSKAAEELLKQARLLDVKNQKIKTLSGGMRQRLMFAQALLDQPKVVILDEPTAGLDPKKRIEMRNFIAEWAKEKDGIIIIATHVVSDVEMIADKILMLDHGKLLAENTVWELTEQLHGRVYEVELKEPSERLEATYKVSSICQRKGRVYAKVIAEKENEGPVDGKLVYPDLEDVYLCYFGEEE